MPNFTRFMIHLPLYDNQGNPARYEIAETGDEILRMFEGLTGVPRLKTAPYEGVWREILDPGALIFVDVPIAEKTNATKYFRKNLNEWTRRFRQIADIYIAVWDIEVLEPF